MSATSQRRPCLFRPRLATALAAGTVALLVLCGASPAPQTHRPSPSPRATPALDPYADRAFVGHMGDGLTAFYDKQFEPARDDFNAALAIAPADSLALSFMNAAVRNIGIDALDDLADQEEDAIAKRPRDPIAQTRLAYTYLFEAQAIAQREDDAKDALNAAIDAAPGLAAAHVGLGIYRMDEGSTNRAKGEFLAALSSQPDDILAHEYLASIYQNDLREPDRALGYFIDVPNLVPGYADAYFHIGSIMNDLGQYDAAVDYLKTAIAMDKGYVGEAGQFGLPLLGDVYLKLHKLDLAKKTYAEAVSMNEEPEYSQEQLARIKAGTVQ